MSDDEKAGGYPPATPHSEIEGQLRQLVAEARRASSITADTVQGWFQKHRCPVPPLAACDRIADAIACLQHPHGAPWIGAIDQRVASVEPKRFSDAFQYLRKSMPELLTLYGDSEMNADRRAAIAQLTAALDNAAGLAKEIRQAASTKTRKDWHLAAITLFRDIELALQEVGAVVSTHRNSPAIDVCRVALCAAGLGGMATNSSISSHIRDWRKQHGDPNDQKLG